VLCINTDISTGS